MSAEMWILVGIGGAVVLGLLVIALMVLLPNRSLPAELRYEVGDASQRGLAGQIIGGI